MINNWEELTFWSSTEWLHAQEKLDDLDSIGLSYNPERHLMFAALDATPLDRVKVAFLGQDPYPVKRLCTGIAFSIPAAEEERPVTLKNIFREYVTDLHHSIPKNGDLTKWTEEGVLLWNCLPTCLSLASKSHDWGEWDVLTKEIIIELSTKNIVYIFMGGVSRRYTNLVGESSIIETAHPVSRGRKNGVKPFFGSRIFSRANAELVKLGKEGIDWRLP